MITIVIPTKNRPDFLIRLLNYYAQTGYQHWLSIGDSSDPFHCERIKEAVKRFEGQLKIQYSYLPNYSIAQSIYRLNQDIQTPYAVLIADDDLLIPNGIEKCITFLEKSNEYHAAHGLGVLFLLKSVGPYGDLLDLGNYKLGEVNDYTASRRIQSFIDNYFVCLFSVHRTAIWKEMWQQVMGMEDTAFGAELLPCCLSAISGKIKKIDTLYLLRQGHQQRYLLSDPYDWITNPKWFSSYAQFSRVLAETLAHQDAIELNEAQRIIKKVFWSYLYRVLTQKYQHAYGHKGGVRENIKRIIVKVPGADKYWLPSWRYLRSRLFHQDRMTLATLLNPRSPYHADFISFYRMVTRPMEADQNLNKIEFAYEKK